MEVTLDLKPETLALITAEAASRGMEVEDYLGKLAEQASGRIVPPPATWEQFARDWAEFCKPIKELPPDVDLPREAMYSDHD
jgi:hypothetical protein